MLFLYILLSVCFLLALSTLLFLHYCLGVHGPVSLSPFSHFSCVHQPVCFPISCWLRTAAWFGVSCFFLPSTSGGLQSVSVAALHYLLVTSTSLCFGFVLFAGCVHQSVCVLSLSYLLVVSTSLFVLALSYLLVVSNSLLLFLPDVFAGMVQLPFCLFFLCYLLAVSSRSLLQFLLCVLCWHCPPSCV